MSDSGSKMKRVIWGLIIFRFILLSLLSASNREVEMNDLNKKLDEVLLPFVENKMISGNLLIVKRDLVVYQKSFGYADYDRKIENNPSTLFRIASVSKPFTALAVLKLTEENKIKLNDPVSTFIKGNKFYQDITIRHLLTHTSGIPSYDRDLKVNNLDSLLSEILKLDLIFTPGTKYEYSNSGYVLLTKIIEDVSKMPYEEYVKKFIFQPAMMTHSGVYYPGQNQILANGYSQEPYKSLVSSEDRNPFGKGDGSIYSTTGDLLNFYKALKAHRIIQKETFAAATQDNQDHYGFGWMIEDFGNLKSIYHYGGMPGYMTGFRMIPDEDLVVIFLFNTDNLLAYALEEEIVHILLKEKSKPVIIKYQSVKKDLAEIIGEYDLGDSTSFKLFEENNDLYFQETGKPKCKALLTGVQSIFIKEANYRISFKKNEEGKVEFTAFLSLFLVTGEKMSK